MREVPKSTNPFLLFHLLAPEELKAVGGGVSLLHVGGTRVALAQEVGPGVDVLQLDIFLAGS